MRDRVTDSETARTEVDDVFVVLCALLFDQSQKDFEEEFFERVFKKMFSNQKTGHVNDLVGGCFDFEKGAFQDDGDEAIKDGVAVGESFDYKGEVDLFGRDHLVEESEFASHQFFWHVLNDFLVDFKVPVLQQGQNQHISFKQVYFEVPQEVL